jgi:glycosyltransferase involved in cell wall biosynthesis
VSRIDPRKGLRVLPEAVARLTAAGHEITLDLIGPTIGLIGDQEADAIREAAARLGVADRVTLRGPVALDRLMPLYREYDIFVLPTRPGEGIPRVLLEAMAGGLPIVTTAVSGISSLIANGENGLLNGGSTAEVVADVERLVSSPPLRQHLIRDGYATARAHTLERQAGEMMRVVSRELNLVLSRSGDLVIDRLIS